MRSHRTVEIQALVRRDREVLERFRQARWTQHLPGPRARPQCVCPLAKATLLTAVDLLAIADEANENAPIIDPIPRLNQKLWLRGADVLLRLHHRAVPCALGFVEDDYPLRRHAFPDPVVQDELVKVTDEHSTP